MHSYHKVRDENNLIKTLTFRRITFHPLAHSILFLSMTWVYLYIKLPCKHNSVTLGLGGWGWWGLHTEFKRSHCFIFFIAVESCLTNQNYDSFIDISKHCESSVTAHSVCL